MEPNKFVLTDEEWGKELEKGVEDYTDMLFEAVWEGSDAQINETLSKQPFCGCSDCFWRETLFYLVPRIIAGYEDGKIVIEE